MGVELLAASLEISPPPLPESQMRRVRGVLSLARAAAIEGEETREGGGLRRRVLKLAAELLRKVRGRGVEGEEWRERKGGERSRGNEMGGEGR